MAYIQPHSILNVIGPCYKALAPEKEPQISVINPEVEDGRTVMAFHGDSVNDRKLRAVLDGLLRPRPGQKAENITFLNPRKQEVTLKADSPQRIRLTDTTRLLLTKQSELSDYLEEVAKLRGKLQAFEPVAGSKPIKMSLGDIQNQESSAKRLELCEAQIPSLEFDVRALEWALKLQPKQVKSENAALLHLPVVASAQPGRMIRLFGHPDDETLDLLRSLYYRVTKNHSASAMFAHAPDVSVMKHEKGHIVPCGVPEEEASKLVSWYEKHRDHAQRGMAPEVTQVWAWVQMIRGWNSVVKASDRINLPNSLKPPRPKGERPTGSAREKELVKSTASQLAELQKLVAHLTGVVTADVKSATTESKPEPSQVPTIKRKASFSNSKPTPWGGKLPKGINLPKWVGEAFDKLKAPLTSRKFFFDSEGALSFNEIVELAGWKTRYLSAQDMVYYVCNADHESNLTGGNPWMDKSFSTNSPEQLRLLLRYTEELKEIDALGFIDSRLASSPLVYDKSSGDIYLWPFWYIMSGGQITTNKNLYLVVGSDGLISSAVDCLISRQATGTTWPADEFCDDGSYPKFSGFFAPGTRALEWTTRVLPEDLEPWRIGLYRLENELKRLRAFGSASEIRISSQFLDSLPERKIASAAQFTMLQTEVDEALAEARPSESSAPEAGETKTPGEESPATEDEDEDLVPVIIRRNGLTYHLYEDTDENTLPNVAVVGCWIHGHFYAIGHVPAPLTVTKRNRVTVGNEIVSVFDLSSTWKKLPAADLSDPVPPSQKDEPQGEAPKPKDSKGKGKEPVPKEQVEEILSPQLAPGGQKSEPEVKPKAKAKSKGKKKPEKAPAPKEDDKSSAGPPKPKAEEEEVKIVEIPGRSKQTQKEWCQCEEYPCKHTDPKVVKLLEQHNVPTVLKLGDAPEWVSPNVRVKLAPKKGQDPLDKKNPAGVLKTPTPYHGDRVPADLLAKAREALKLLDTPLPEGLTPAERKVEIKKRRTPRWVTAALSADPSNLEKIVSGEINSETKIPGKPRNANAAPSQKEPSPDRQKPVGEMWKALKEKFNGVELWSNPQTQKEKAFRAEFDELRKSVPGGKSDALPKLRRRPRNFRAADSTTPPVQQAPSGSSSNALGDLLATARALGEIVKALKS